jgi:glycerophosphoryl diester phosphodiesterase
MAAFGAAMEAGYGIELDVRLSSDGVPMVFHDGGLERMIGRQGRLADHTAAELSAMRLRDSGEPVPRLEDVLELVSGESMLHIEIKSRPGQESPLDEAVAGLVDRYGGPFAIIGFNPFSHAWWATHRPEILRGLDCLKSEDLVQHIPIAQPHFLALSKDILTSGPAAKAREAGFAVAAWTIRSEAEAADAAPHVDNIIFEGFRP